LQSDVGGYTKKPPYSKILAIQNHLNGCDWLVWIDLDCVVKDISWRIEPWLPMDGRWMLIAGRDFGDACTGFMAFKASDPEAHDFLRVWTKTPCHHTHITDNGAFLWLRIQPRWRGQIAYVPMDQSAAFHWDYWDAPIKHYATPARDPTEKAQIILTDGNSVRIVGHTPKYPLPDPTKVGGDPTFGVYITTCEGREETLARTLQSIRDSDLGIEPIISYDRDVIEGLGRSIEFGLHRAAANHIAALKHFLKTGKPWLLMMEDDILVNPHLRRAIETWQPFVDGTLEAGTFLMAPNKYRFVTRPLGDRVVEVSPRGYYGGQCLLVRRDIAEMVLREYRAWETPICFDTSLPRTLIRHRKNILLHDPPLVEHQPDVRSKWTGKLNWQGVGTDLNWVPPT